MSQAACQLRLATLPIAPGAFGSRGWTLPGFRPERVLDFRYYQELAQTAERGKLDFLFLPDMYTVRADDPESLASFINVWPEPVTLMSSLVGVTERIGLAITSSTTYQEPFHTARMIASLDHLSRGRAAWNLVSSRGEFEAHNFRNDHRPPVEDRHTHSQEFLEVVNRLWDSWEDDAIVIDRAAGRFADAARIHHLHHQGAWLTVRGPLNVARPPQGRPVIIQAGASPAFRASAARTADVIFTQLGTLETAIEFTTDVRQQAAAAGRGPDRLLVMPGMTLVTGECRTEIDRKLAERSALLPRAAEARAGHCRFEGLPEEIADQMEEWLTRGAVDGFIFIPFLLPGDLDDLVNLVMPALQRRGLFRIEYPGTTLRDVLGLPRPVNLFTDNAGAP